ncbi:MAG: HD-GYP domain-containing protein, partial [Elusimicrobiota bacterium]
RVDIDRENLDIIEKLSEQVQESPKKMLEYFYENTPVNYLYAHAVNVCILSNILIRNMIYNKDQIMKLSIAAFFHDLGMSNYIETVNEERRLKFKEFKKVKKHPEDLKDILKNIDTVSDDLALDIIKIASQHHERSDGSGYPEGIGGQAIDRMASIIAVSDVYEALTHDRVWRLAYNRAKAMDIIVDSRGKHFPSQIVRTLIDELTLFPVGSIVELSDGRKAKVVKTNSQSPTCPTVKIQDSNGKMINLSRDKLISIDGICEESG